MKGIRKYLYIFVIMQVVILLLINGLTYARYISNSVFNYYLKSKAFYFTSDYLGTEAIKNVNNFWDGGSTYFSVKNSINNGAVSESDIDYTVTCSVGDLASNVDCVVGESNTFSASSTYSGTLSVFKSCINNTDDGVNISTMTDAECEMGGYTYKNHAMEADLYFDLIPKNGYEISDVTVTIMVTTSPYNKVLSGNFILHKADPITGNIDSIYENYSSYDRLTITNTYLQDKCINVRFNSNNLRINNNFETITTATDGYINGFKDNIGAQSNKSYIFYKTSDKTNTIEDFVIEESSGC